MLRTTVLVVLAISVLGSAFLAAEIKIVSRNDNGDVAAFSSTVFDVSEDGTQVLMSYTNILLPNDDPDRIPTSGLYYRNISADTQTLLVSSEDQNLPFEGSVFSATMSGDARYIAFDGGILSTRVDVFILDTQTSVITSLTEGADGSSYQPKISSDGRYVVFYSVARNFEGTGGLLPAEGRGALYRYDTNDGSIDLISVTASGAALDTGVGSATVNIGRFDWDFSGDGKYIVFSSEATNVVDGAVPPVFNVYMYRRHLDTGVVDIVNAQPGGAVSAGAYSNPSISDDGNRVAFIGGFLGLDAPNPDAPTTFSNEAFAKDFTTDTVWWVSRTIGNVSLAADFGSVTNVEISGDGSVVALDATSENLVEETTGQFNDIFRVDLVDDGTTTIELLSGVGDGSDTNVRVDAPESLFLPSNGAYIAWKTTEAAALTNLGEELREDKQVVASGDFSNLGSGGGGGENAFTEWASNLPEGVRGETDTAFPDGVPNLVRYVLNLPTDQAAGPQLFDYGVMSAEDLGIGVASDLYGTAIVDIRVNLDQAITWKLLTGRTMDELLGGTSEAVVVGTPTSNGDTMRYTVRTPFLTNNENKVFFSLAASDG